MQLKRILLDTRLKHPNTITPLLSFTGLAIVCANILQDKSLSDWRFYFFFCVAYYQDLHIRHALYEYVLQGTLAVAVVVEALAPREAEKIMEAARRRGQHHCASHQYTVLFPIDLGTSNTITDANRVSVSAWANRFEDLMIRAEG